jgi:tetratricopeptide (TPR) repeat protein
VTGRTLERLRAPLLAAGLLALCWLVFAPALTAGFLLWDDTDNLLTNTHWRGLGGEQLAWMFTTLHLGPYQPLAWLSYALDWELWGLDAQAFHRTNLLLHSLNALLCFACARELLRRRWPAPDVAAAAAAALFALHPLRVESVAWITERRDVLSGLFLLVSLRLWLAYTGGGGWRTYTLALLAYACSLLSKASSVGWPLVLLALDVWVLERGPWRERVREKLPFFALALGFSALALFGQAELQGTMATWAEHGLLARLAQSSYGWLYYPLQSLAVVGVQPIYDLSLPMNVLEPRFLAALVLAPALFTAAWMLRARCPAAWAAVLAYTLLALPLLGLAQAGPQLVAARYSYLACLPLALLAGAWVARLPRAAAPAALALALLPGWRAHADTRHWRSDRELWTHARELDPSSRVAVRNLVPAVFAEARAAADPALRRARLEEALDLCVQGRALGLDPQLESSRGAVLAALAELDPVRAPELLEQALAALRSAIELARATRSDVTAPQANLITLLDRMGRPAEALPLCEDWIARSPGSGSAWAARARVQAALGQGQLALESLDRALALDRDLPGAWLDRGIILEAFGRHEEARRSFEEVLAARQRLGAGLPEAADAREARMQLERLGPAPSGPPLR